jgi:hypothetical protein
MKRKDIWWAVAFILIGALSALGCYNQRKATNQFSKAVVAYPKIGADYCGDAYPVRDSIIKGDSILTTDTVTYFEQLSDTVMIHDFDTVRVYITKTLPAKIITNTIHTIDTIIKEGGGTLAKLTSCQIDNSRLTQLLVTVTADRDKWQGKAKTRWWWIALLIGGIVGTIAIKIFGKTKLPI